MEGVNIGQRLSISGEDYESLNEIIDRYLNPCNRQVKEIRNHSKFLVCSSIEEFEERLTREKKEEPSRIPYRFGFFEKYPQHVVLGYVPKEKMVREYIKVKPKGYFFHNNYHFPIDTLINWFKNNFRSKEYQSILRRAQSPKVVIHSVPAQPPLMNTNIGMRLDQPTHHHSEFNRSPNSPSNNWGADENEGFGYTAAPKDDFN